MNEEEEEETIVEEESEPTAEGCLDALLMEGM
jgi:hypothetical protein